MVQGGGGALGVSENQTEEDEGDLCRNPGVALGEAGPSSRGASEDLRKKKKKKKSH